MIRIIIIIVALITVIFGGGFGIVTFAPRVLPKPVLNWEKKAIDRKTIVKSIEVFNKWLFEIDAGRIQLEDWIINEEGKRFSATAAGGTSAVFLAEANAPRPTRGLARAHVSRFVNKEF